MKAEYIIEAIQILREASVINPYNGDAGAFELGKLQARASQAASTLLVYSGLNQVEVAVEKDAA